MNENATPSRFTPTPRTAMWAGVVVICCATIVWAWVEITHPTNFVVEKVRLEGTFAHLNAQNAEAQIAKNIHGNFFTIDMNALSAALHELPWIKRVELQRVWPGSLRVTVYEREVVAFWTKGGALDRDGEVFNPDPSTLAATLPVINGPQGLESTLVQEFLSMQRLLNGLDTQIERLDVDARRAYRLTVRGGTQIMLGRKDMESRLARYVRAYPRLTDEQRQHVIRVDLRYNNGFALARDDTRAPLHKG